MSLKPKFFILPMLCGTLSVSGCLRTAVVSAGSSVVGAAGSAVGAAASATTSAVSSVSALATGGPSASSTSTSATAASSSSGGSAGLSTTETGAIASVSAVVAAANMSQGMTTCLTSARYNAVVTENLASYGWQIGRGLEQSRTDPARAQTVSKPGVRGTVFPNGGCTFQSTDVAFTQLSNTVREELGKTFQTGVTLGGPNGNTSPCDGYTIDVPGLHAWVSYTSANGDVCTRETDGAGLTMRLL